MEIRVSHRQQGKSWSMLFAMDGPIVRILKVFGRERRPMASDELMGKAELHGPDHTRSCLEAMIGTGLLKFDGEKYDITEAGKASGKTRRRSQRPPETLL